MAMWQEIEKIFGRSLRLSFSKEKFVFVFPVLALCGLVASFCRALAEGGNPWVVNSLAFLPIFISACLIMAAGVALIRLYHDEIKQKECSLSRILWQARALMLQTFSFVFPLLGACLILWLILGFFYLLKMVPHIGNSLSIIFSFGPFILILGSLILSFISLLFLFFITPLIALKSSMRWEVIRAIFEGFRMNLFGYGALLCIALVPFLFVVSLLVLAANLTNITYLMPGLMAESKGTVFFEWFFLMVPFGAVLSPAVIFFFNFAAESFVLMRKWTRVGVSLE